MSELMTRAITWISAVVLAFLVAIVAVVAGEPPAAAAAEPHAIADLGRNIDDVPLKNDAGATVRWADLNGRPRAVFFGFTNCPVICPVTVWELDAALAEIGPAGERIRVNFVTLDPARDTPAVLRDYFSSFKLRVSGFSGTEADIKKIAKSFDVTFEKVALGKSGYTLDHTAAVFLLDEKGRVVDAVAYGAPRKEIVARLRSLIAPVTKQ
jgi:protein SCO1